MTRTIRDLAGGSAAMLEIFADAAVIRHGLAFEAALAEALAVSGIVSAANVARIVETCRTITLDAEALAKKAAHAGTLAIPLVAHLRAEVGGDTAEDVHRGATSQDVADTVMALQAREGLVLILSTLGRMQTALAALAARTAALPVLSRTLLQAAVPSTFGLRVIGWLDGLDGAVKRLSSEAAGIAMLQFGGAAGTRAGLNGKGAEVAAHMARTLGLSTPPHAWHADRTAVAGLASVLAIVTGAAGKIARDIALLSQTEIAEVFEPQQPGRGGSSTMAHKRNPTGCQVVLSAAQRAPHLAATILSGLPQELERGLGGWQAEAPVLADLFVLCQGALEALAPVVEGLELNAGKMASNLKAAAVGADPGEAEAMVKAALAARKQP